MFLWVRFERTGFSHARRAFLVLPLTIAGANASNLEGLQINKNGELTRLVSTAARGVAAPNRPVLSTRSWP